MNECDVQNVKWKEILKSYLWYCLKVVLVVISTLPDNSVELMITTFVKTLLSLAFYFQHEKQKKI